MNNIDTGGCVHPKPIRLEQVTPEKIEYAFEGGMTLRDHFAGLAIQGILANPTTDQDIMQHQLAEIAYEQADEMISVRNETQ